MCIFANLNTITRGLSHMNGHLWQYYKVPLIDQSISPISIRMQYWKLPEVSHQIDIG